MRICLVTSTFLPKLGGAELCVDALASHFTAAGHEVVVLAPEPKKAVGRNDEYGYRVCRFGRPISQYGRYGAAVRLGDRLHGEEPFDIINAHMTYPAGYIGEKLAKRWGVPLVITPHGGGLFYRSRFRRRVVIWSRIVKALDRADGVIALSGYFEQLIREAAPAQKQVVRICNGVNLDEFQGAGDVFGGDLAELNGIRYVLGIGRLVGRKGFDCALRAWSRLGAAVGLVKLVLAGDGPQREDLESLAEELGIADRVMFVGAQRGDNKVALLKRAQLVVVPSVEEDNMPLVVLEAMAAGRPVLGSRLGGIPDVVRNGYNGSLFEPGQDGEMADGLARLLDESNRADLEQMAQHAHETAEGLSWERIAREYLQLFGRIVSSGRTDMLR